MSILSALFSHGSVAELFCQPNKPAMMCLRVNVQCANCFDLSRNKSDWHFISIFVGHNRPLPCIVERAAVLSVRRRYYFQKRGAYAPREPNYFDLFRVSLIHRKTLFFFPVAYFFFYLRFFFISRAHTHTHTVCGSGCNLFCFYSAGQRSVVISAVRADVFAIFAQNAYVHTRPDLRV